MYLNFNIGGFYATLFHPRFIIFCLSTTEKRIWIFGIYIINYLVALLFTKDKFTFGGLN
jgi:hypothetical protein